MKSLLLFACLSTLYCSAQDYGYFGRKNVLELSGHGAYPLLSGIGGNNVIFKKTHAGNLTKKNNVFDGGFHTGLTHAVSNKFGIGLELNYDFQEIQFKNQVKATFETSNGYQYTDFVSGRYEHIDHRTSTVLIKFEFSGRNSLLPVGISHQFGIGRSVTKLVEKDYREDFFFTADQIEDSLISIESFDQTLNFNKKYSGLMIMYKLNFRTPVSGRFVLNYGARFTLNAATNSNFSSSIKSHLKTDRLRSIAQLYFGTSFVF